MLEVVSELLMLLTDEWGVEARMLFVFLLVSLLISLVVILLLVIGIICVKFSTNHQPGV